MPKQSIKTVTRRESDKRIDMLINIVNDLRNIDIKGIYEKLDTLNISCAEKHKPIDEFIMTDRIKKEEEEKKQIKKERGLNISYLTVWLVIGLLTICAFFVFVKQEGSIEALKRMNQIPLTQTSNGG